MAERFQRDVGRLRAREIDRDDLIHLAEEFESTVRDLIQEAEFQVGQAFAASREIDDRVVAHTHAVGEIQFAKTSRAHAVGETLHAGVADQQTVGHVQNAQLFQCADRLHAVVGQRWAIIDGDVAQFRTGKTDLSEMLRGKENDDDRQGLKVRLLDR